MCLSLSLHIDTAVAVPLPMHAIESLYVGMLSNATELAQRLVSSSLFVPASQPESM